MTNFTRSLLASALVSCGMGAAAITLASWDREEADEGENLSTETLSPIIKLYPDTSPEKTKHAPLADEKRT